jgi:hypothetical protein
MSEFVKELVVLVDAFIAIRAEEEEIEREKKRARRKWGFLASVWERLGLVHGWSRMKRWETVVKRFCELCCCFPLPPSVAD